MLIPAVHDWGTHTIPVNPAWALELWATSADLPRPTSTHRTGIWENYLALSALAKNMSGCLIPECPSPSTAFSSFKPKLKHFIWGEAWGMHTNPCLNQNEHLHLLSSPCALPFHCLFGTHIIWPCGTEGSTQVKPMEWYVHQTRENLLYVSELSVSIHNYQEQKTLNTYVCWTELLTGYRNCFCFPLSHAQLPAIIHIP